MTEQEQGEVGRGLMITVPQLFAKSESVGPHRCFYCGGSCGDEYPTADHVKKTFTGRSGVACPDSKFICDGCVLGLRESCEIVVGGEIRASQKVRNYSWVIDSSGPRAYTKAHIKELRAICLAPPSPPFAIILATSGQKHLLYRGVVNLDAGSVTVSLEENHVTYAPSDLVAMIGLTSRLVAATGKPALDESPGLSLAREVIGRFSNGDSLFAQWSEVWESPIARLAAFLTDNKERCSDVYKSDFL